MLQKKLRIQSAQEKDIKYLEASYHLLATKFYNQVPYATPKAVETTLEFVAGARSEPKALEKGAVRESEKGFMRHFRREVWLKDRLCEGLVLRLHLRMTYVIRSIIDPPVE